MANKQRGKEIAPLIRGAFIRAVKALEDGGKPLSTLIKQQLEERPLETLKAISAFVPKEMLIEADITTQISEMTDDTLKAEIKRLAGQIELH